MNRSLVRVGTRVLARALCMTTALSVASRGQLASPVAIHVHVVDSAHAPIANADVAVVHGLNDVLAAGQTDRNGLLLLRFSRHEDNYQVVVRKLGYARASKFVLAGQSDSLSIDVTLSKASQRLDTVKVIAEVNRTRERTFIDADAIAASGRPLFDAVDVIEKLRPNMTVEPPDATGQCLPARNLWVNGVRVAWRFPSVSTRTRAGGVRAEVPLARPGRALRAASDDEILALASIKPEHIASIEYRNCFSTTVNKIGGESALYVILKDGIAFRMGVGSYVITAAEQDSILKAITRH